MWRLVYDVCSVCRLSCVMSGYVALGLFICYLKKKTIRRCCVSSVRLVGFVDFDKIRFLCCIYCIYCFLCILSGAENDTLSSGLLLRSIKFTLSLII